MITIKNVRTLGGEVVTHTIESSHAYDIDAQENLLLFPGLIDPHVTFGAVEQDNWNLSVESSIRGGVTTAIDILPVSFIHKSKKDLEIANERIEKRLAELKIPLGYFRFLPYKQETLSEIEQLGGKKPFAKGIVIQFEEEDFHDLEGKWEDLFRLAAHEDLPVVINSRNENTLAWDMKKEHSLLENGIQHAEKWGCRLLVLNVSTLREIELIKAARKKQVLVYAETTPQHLFSQTNDTRVLWEALNQDLIEVIGSGYDGTQPGEERIVYRGANFSAADPLFLLPRLMTAYHQKKILIEKLYHLTSTNIQDILELKKTRNFVLVDLEHEETLTVLREGKSSQLKLKGWPAYTIVDGHVFSPPQSGYSLQHLN